MKYRLRFLLLWLAVLTAQAAAPRPNVVLLLSDDLGWPIVALRDGRYSLVADPDYVLPTTNDFQEAWIPAIKTGGYTNYHLFDLETDPAQQHDLAGRQPELLEQLKRKLTAINASIMADAADWHLQQR